MSLAAKYSDESGRNAGAAPPAPLLVTLIRHPETVANISHALQGSTDSPLTVNGQQQAARLADAVRRASRSRQLSSVSRTDSSTCSPLTRGGRPPTHIWSSPAGRAQKLATAIETASQFDDASLAYSSPKLVIRDGLAERCFGPREGSIYSQRGNGKEARFVIDPSERITTPAESKEAFSLRVRRELDYLVTFLRQHRHEQNGQSPTHVILVTHGLWIGTFLRLVLHPDDRQPFAHNTGLFTLSFLSSEGSAFGGRSFRVVTQNDTTHLLGLKRQRGGIGSSASDVRQQTLKQLWSSATKAAQPDGNIATSSPPSRAGQRARRGQQDLKSMWSGSKPYDR